MSQRRHARLLKGRKSAYKRAKAKRLKMEKLEARQLLAANVFDDVLTLGADSAINVLTNDTSGNEVQNVSAFQADVTNINAAGNDADWSIPLRDDGVTPQRSLIPGAVMFQDNRADAFNGGANNGDIDLLRDTDTDFTNDDQLTEADRLNAGDGIGLPVIRNNDPVGDPPTNIGVPQYQTEGGDSPNWIAIAAGPENAGELSTPLSNAFFPFDAGWVGGAYDSGGNEVFGTDANANSTPDISVTGGGGRYEATVEGVTDSFSEGFLFSVGGDNEDNYTRTRPIEGGRWAVQHRDNSSELGGAESDNFNLLYIPRNAQGLIGGVVNGASDAVNPMRQSFGDFEIQQESDGFWRLSVPGQSVRSGVLVLQTYDLSVDQPRNAYFTYDDAGDGTDDMLIRQFAWDSNTETPLNTDFAFFFIPFENTLSPSHELTVTDLGTAASPSSGLSEKGLALSVNADGTVNYDTGGAIRALAEGETDSDSFVYTATDGTDNATATVTVNWRGVNDAPDVLGEPGELTLDEDDSPVTIDLTTIFEDVDDGDSLTYSFDPGLVGSIVSGEISGDDLIITPGADSFGFTRGTITAVDTSGLSKSVELPISILPVVGDDQVEAVDDEAVTDLATPVDVSVLDNDFHPDTSRFSVSAAEIFGNSDATGNDDTVWNVVNTTAAPNDLTIQSGPNLGDVAVGRGGLDLSLAEGVFLGTVRDNTEPYQTVNNYDAFGSYGFATDTGVGGGERNSPLSAAFFPFAEGWTAGHIGTDGSLIGGIGISPSDVVKLGDGLWEVTIPEATAAQFDGMLYAMGGNNDDNVVSVAPQFDNRWIIRQIDSDSDATGFENDPISFVYVPGTTPDLIGGRVVSQEGTPFLTQEYGNVNLSTTTDAEADPLLTFPGFTPDDGALIAVSTGTELADLDDDGIFETEIPLNNAVLATPEGDGFRIDVQQTGDWTSPTQFGEFQFMFLPYSDPLERIEGLDFSVTSFDATSNLGASISQNPDGTLNYDPGGAGSPIADLEGGESIVDTFTYTITDGRGDMATATASITVLGENREPTAGDDVINLNELSAQNATLTVLGNDTDPDLENLLGSIQGTSAGNLSVDASSVWSVAATGSSPNAITVGTGSTGQVEVLRDGTPITPAEGVVLATVRDNFEGDATNFRLVQAYENASGGTSLAVEQFGEDGDADAPVSIAYFPFDDNWVAGHVNPGGTLTDGSGLSDADVTRTETGRYRVSVPGVSDAAGDGFLFVIGNENADNVVSARAVPGSNVYEVGVRDNEQDFGDGEDGGFSFVFVPRNAENLVAGAIDPFVDGPNAVSPGVGEFSVERQEIAEGNFEWKVSIPGESPDTGMLILTNQDNGEIEDNFLSYEADGEGNFLIRSHDMDALGLQNQPFTFAFIPFDGPNRPAARPVPGLLSIDSVDATSALGATLTINPDGTINYDPGDLLDSLYNGDSTTDSFTYTMSDGFGGTDTATVTLNVDGFGEAPEITVDDAASYYGIGDDPVGIDPAADLVPIGVPFLDGALATFEVTSGGVSTDVLSVRNEGTGAGQIGVSGSDITYEGTVIGSFTGGSGATPLAITLNAAATEAAADALLRAVSFSNTDPDLAPSFREVTISLVDGNGRAGTPVTKEIELGLIRRRSLQNGVDTGFGVYTAAADAELDESNPDTVRNPADNILIDFNLDGSADQALLKFEDLFGDGPGQISAGSIITSATLVLETNTDRSGNAPVTVPPSTGCSRTGMPPPPPGTRWAAACKRTTPKHAARSNRKSGRPPAGATPAPARWRSASCPTCGPGPRGKPTTAGRSPAGTATPTAGSSAAPRTRSRTSGRGSKSSGWQPGPTWSASSRESTATTRRLTPRSMRVPPTRTFRQLRPCSSTTQTPAR